MRATRLGLALGFIGMAVFASRPAPAQDLIIDLGNITAGGDGVAAPPEGNIGINADTGAFIQARLNADVPEANGLNPMLVDGFDGSDDSPYIDSVFIIDLGIGQVINSAGVTFDFDAGDVAGGWEGILDGREPGGPDSLLFGQETPFDRGVGLHAAQGITYDLAAIRDAHGDENVQWFFAVAGEAAGQIAGHVNAYVILSDENGVLSSESVLDATDSGRVVQFEVPADAQYLTLAVGAAGDGIGSDHGGFGLAQLSGAETEVSPAGLEILPSTLSLAPGATQQLSVSTVSNFGERVDVTSTANGTSYTVEPAGVASVDADGLLTAESTGTATVTATNGAFSAEAVVTVANFIELGNIAAGGNGVEAPLPGVIGINADTGAFINARIAADVPEANGINPMPVDGFDGSSDSPFIDSVFIIDVGLGQVINSAGVAFDFDAGDVAGGWEGILNGREPGGPDSLSFGALGPYTSGVGVHAAQGITFDLAALRDEHGEERVRYFSAIAGEASGQAAGHINAYVIVSNEDEVLLSASALDMTDRGRLIHFEIPDEADYLTLAVGAAGDGIGSDHGGFGLARISPDPLDLSSLTNLTLTPPTANLAVNGTVQVSVTGTVGAGDLAGATVSIDAADVDFESSKPEVATIDETGLVTGVADGRATITATFGAESIEMTVTVGQIFDLGDIVRGGDGAGGIFVFNDGIDPRNGLFVSGGIDGTIQETDPEGDGLNPSPVPDSPFVDSVFFIGPTEDPEAEFYSQAITESGVVFDFPNEHAIGTGWNYILAGSNGGVTGGPMLVGGQTFERGFGAHASTGITFDLDALREEHGEEKIGTFSTFWGMDACAGDVVLYAIFSNDDGVISFESQQALANEGFLLEVGIPSNASYLTLATGSNGADGCDHGSYAEAIIVPGGGVEPPTEVFIRGDADGSGVINITDGVFILNFLFTGGADPGCKDAADADDSGVINITDGVYVLNFLFTGGADPLPPWPGCGADPTDDAVDCMTPHPSCL